MSKTSLTDTDAEIDDILHIVSSNDHGRPTYEYFKGWDEGFVDYTNLISITSCPYERYSMSEKGWIYGWLAAKFNNY